MVMGWRRAFCTSTWRDPDGENLHQQLEQQEKEKEKENESPSPTPRSCAKLRLFGGSSINSSTPRLQQQTHRSAKEDTGVIIGCGVEEGPPPKLHCRTSTTMADSAATRPFKSPRFLFRAAASNPNTPISPSRFALLKASLGFSKNRCGICLQSVKRGGGHQAVFTAECHHPFHLPCIAAHITPTHPHHQHQELSNVACPVCSTPWRQSSFLKTLSDNCQKHRLEQEQTIHPQGGGCGHGRQRGASTSSSKRYDDDEPLQYSPTNTAPGTAFSPIPEADEEDDDAAIQDQQETFKGLFVSNGADATGHCAFPAGIKVEVAPVAALVSTGRRHENYVISVKIKAPPTAPLLDPSLRASIDLVTVLDVGGSMTAAKMYMLKCTMRLLISSLGPADRLAIVAFSSLTAKRLVPLRRMSPHGRRSARHIVDRLVVCGGQGTCVVEALKKAAKILEDRRERNPVATVMLVSDAHAQRTPSCAASATHFAHLQIPIHEDNQGNAFTKYVGGLLSVVVQDLHLRLTLQSGEILAVYSPGSGMRNLWPEVGEGRLFRVGDLYAEEERELMVELRMPWAAHTLPPQSLSVKCTYREPLTQELLRWPSTPLPMPPLSQCGDPIGSERLRGIFVTTRALAESHRLAELNDVSTAIRLLSSARSLLPQYPSTEESLVRSVEAELIVLHRRRQSQRRRRLIEHEQQQTYPQPAGMATSAAEGLSGDALTPTSAWRAAERLAKVAIMRKSMNRVSDLHGFENARF